MSIQPYSSSTAVRSLSRAGRQVARVVDGTELEVVRVAGSAAIESAKLDATQAIASQAMYGVALVSQTEVQLAQLVPMASGRLAAIGDIFALSAAEIVSSTPRRLG